MAAKENIFLRWLKASAPLQVLAIILAGPAITAVILLILLLTVFAGWDISQQELQLQILREASAYSYVILLIIIGALTAGLVRGFKVGIGKVTAELDLADEHDGQEVQARIAHEENERRRLEKETEESEGSKFWRRGRRPEFSSNETQFEGPGADEFTAPDPCVDDN